MFILYGALYPIRFIIFLKIFKKNKLKKLFLYKVYNYKIKLKSLVNSLKNHFLYNVSPYKFNKVKKYLKKKLVKSFIISSLI